MNTEKCAKCGASYPSAGDGYCELCPTCADREEQAAMEKLSDFISDLCRLHSMPLGALWLIFDDESHDDIQEAVNRLIDQGRIYWDSDERLSKVR